MNLQIAKPVKVSFYHLITSINGKVVLDIEQLLQSLSKPKCTYVRVLYGLNLSSGEKGLIDVSLLQNVAIRIKHCRASPAP